MHRIALLAVMTAVMAVGIAGTATAAHNGNNKAELAGTAADPDATGNAVVNYREGTGTFNGRTTVANLVPGAFYEFVVRLGNNEATDQTICSGEANSQGTFTCNAQDLALAGFSRAVIEDAAGNDVASGTFARRGNCRDPDQGGSQCDAPGQNR